MKPGKPNSLMMTQLSRGLTLLPNDYVRDVTSALSDRLDNKQIVFNDWFRLCNFVDAIQRHLQKKKKIDQ